LRWFNIYDSTEEMHPLHPARGIIT